ncbi:MAG: cytochrome c [Deltaproteobacteria bacterium]|nr:cytochrome c [Deltaproteobacteria bacterium]
MQLRVVLLTAVMTMLGSISDGCRTSPRTLTPVQRGEVLYRTNCASCHGRDPNRPGALGPAIAGSSRALIEARVLHRAYPAGYQPKRQTHLMQPMPWMAAHIDDLAAYLGASATDRPSVKVARHEN